MKSFLKDKREKVLFLSAPLSFLLSFFGLSSFPLTLLWVYAPFVSFFLVAITIGTTLFFMNSHMSLILFLGTCFGVAVFSETLRKKQNIILSLFGATFFSALLMGLFFYGLSFLGLQEPLLEQLELFKEKTFSLKALESLKDEEKAMLLKQSPSSFLIFLSAVLFLSRIFLVNLASSQKKKKKQADKKLQAKAQSLKTKAFEREVSHSDKVLLARVWQDSLKVPFFFIWLFMASLVGTFFLEDHKILHTVSVNALNLFLFAYFLQGFAILKKYFQTLQIGVSWRVLAYMAVFSFALFLPLSLMGLIEEWVPFRERLEKKRKQREKEKKKEKKQN